MQTFTINLKGPLLSAGGACPFPHYRTTGDEPTPSQLKGLIAAAFGWARNSPELHDGMIELEQLSFAIRPVGNPAQVTRDFHTVKNAMTVDGRTKTMTTRRDYLSNVHFQVDVTGPDELIQRVIRAIQDPKFVLYLGRKACVPSEPVLVPC